jgi:hypothetical protein
MGALGGRRMPRRPDLRAPFRRPGDSHVEALVQRVFDALGAPGEAERDWAEVLARAGVVAASGASPRGARRAAPVVPEALGWGTRPL